MNIKRFIIIFEMLAFSLITYGYYQDALPYFKTKYLLMQGAFPMVICLISMLLYVKFLFDELNHVFAMHNMIIVRLTYKGYIGYLIKKLSILIICLMIGNILIDIVLIPKLIMENMILILLESILFMIAMIIPIIKGKPSFLLSCGMMFIIRLMISFCMLI